MLSKCFQQHQQFLKHGCLSVKWLLGYFSVIKHSVLYRLMTQSKVLKCNLVLVIFHFKPPRVGLYPIPWYHWFISIKIPHVQAPQLVTVTIDSPPQGFVHSFWVGHRQLSTSPLGLNGSGGSRNLLAKNFLMLVIKKRQLFLKCLLCSKYYSINFIYVNSFKGHNNPIGQ